MVTIVNNNKFIFNGVKPGESIDIDEQYLDAYQENGFDLEKKKAVPLKKVVPATHVQEPDAPAEATPDEGEAQADGATNTPPAPAKKSK